jgi:dissimilatory sulfite reductase (desulfoviridin) alpha/beta subunit
MDQTGFELRIGMGSTNLLQTRCLTMGEEMMSRYAADQQVSLGYRVGTALQTISNYMLLSQVNFLKKIGFL